MQRFIDEADRLVKTYDPARSIITKEGPRFINLYLVDPNTPATEKESLYARVEKDTLNIYAPNGKKPRGNINHMYGGFDTIDKFGVIVNNKKYDERLRELFK